MDKIATDQVQTRCSVTGAPAPNPRTTKDVMRDYDLIAVLEGQHPTPPLPAVQMVVLGGLTAVLSAAPRPKQRPLQSLRQHLADAVAHEARQNACMVMAPILPVRLDTPLTLPGTASFLTANQPFLDQLLARYAGMAQVQVTVLGQDSSAMAHLGSSTATLQQVAQRLSAQIGAEIAKVAVEVMPLALTPGAVWSGVVLVPLQDLSDLTRALAKVTALEPQRLAVRQGGPDPVKAFATLDLSPVTPRQIDLALTSFGLHALADLAQLPALRRRRLQSATGFDDGALRSEIHDQAEMLTAAARLDDPRSGFALCRIWSASRMRPQPHDRAVA